VKLFKSNISAGFDDIHPSVVKNVISTIAQPLADTVNLSLYSGIFPDQLKIAKVVSIFKNENRRLVKTYRPISILPFFQKSSKKLCLCD